MKKLLLIFLLFFAAKSFAQYPAIQNLGNDSTLIRIGATYNGGIKGGLINMTVADTTAANLLRIKAYPGAMIFTTNDGLAWVRNMTATGWVLLGGGSSPSGSFWRVGGNEFPITLPTRDIGTGSFYGGAVGLMTNGIVRAIVPNIGFTLSNDTSSNKIFTINPTTKEWGYTNWNNSPISFTALTFDRYTINFNSNSFYDSTLIDNTVSTTKWNDGTGLIVNSSYAGSLTASKLIAQKYGTSVSQNVTQRLVFKVLDSTSLVNIGIGTDNSQTLGATTTMAYLSGTVGSYPFYVINWSNGFLTAVDSVNIQIGDIIELVFEARSDTSIVKFRNLTHNKYLEIKRGISSTTTAATQRNGYPSIFIKSGHFKLLEYDIMRPDFQFSVIGNSIASGNNASRYDTSHVFRLQRRSQGALNLMAKPSSTSTDYLKASREVLSMTNKVVFLDGLMGNDPQASISYDTSKARYSRLVSGLKANGNTVVHIDISYRSTFTGGQPWSYFQSLNNWLDTAFGATDRVVHLDSLTAAQLSDGVHPNDDGHNSMYNSIYRNLPEYFGQTSATTAQINRIYNPYNGQLIFNSDSSALFYWNGSAWTKTSGSGGGGSQNLQQVTDIGNTTTKSIQVGDSLRVQGGTDPFVAMKQATSNQEYRLRVGVGTGLSSQSFSLYDATAGASRMVITTAGHMVIGRESLPADHSRLLVYGGLNGANIDALPDSTQNDESNMEVMGADYYGSSFQGYGVAMTYNGNANTGSIMNYSKKNFGQVRFTGVTNFIRVIPNASLRFATNNIERMVLDSNGNVGIGVKVPSYKLHVEAATGATTTPFYVNDSEDNTGYVAQFGKAGVLKAAIGTDGNIYMVDMSAPSTPSSGYGTVYVRADSLRFKNDGGTEFTLGRSSGSGGTPGGSNKQIQYNNSSAFAGSANLTQETNQILVTGTSTSVVPFAVKQIAAQSSNTAEFQNSSGTNLVSIGVGGQVVSVQNITAFSGGAEQVQIGYTNLGSASVAFGASSDTYLYKLSAGRLRIFNGSTDGDLTARSVTWSGRVLEKQGADVASANNLSLGTDGNAFEITGTTTINLISNTSWQNGSVIRLVFSSSLTVTNNAGTSGTNINILLAGGANFSATANDCLTLMLCEIGGTQQWLETGRSVN